MNIFFDLDGTLLDSRKRLYYLFQQLVPDSTLSYDDYWNFKRNKIGHKEILNTQFGYSDEMFLFFEKEWMKKIELREWLDMDKPFEGVTNYLNELKNKHSLYVVTARQFERVAVQQINDNGWAGIFEGILVTSQKKEKYDLIHSSVKLSNEDWMVGDTGKDIETGKRLEIKTAAVLTGFLSKEKLIEYHPDEIVNSVLDLDF